MTRRKTAATDAALRALRAFGLAYPGAHTKSPWPGHLDLAVNDKTFAYLSLEGEPLKVSCKLPHTSAMALLLPGCAPTPYGLGRSGWVTATFAGPDVPIAMLEAWIDESYRAQAPKKLVKLLTTAAPPPATPLTPRTPARAKRPTPKARARRRARAASR